jgi:outer membrane protein assembly factor BamB
MKHRIPVLVISALLIAPAAADDWPQWRGPTRDGTWTETGLRDSLPEGQLPLKWKVPIGAGYSGPTVANGRVYVSDRVVEPEEQERVHCFEGLAASPIIEGNMLIVPVSAKDDGAYLVAFDVKTGEERWRSLSDNGNYSAPIIVEQAGKRVLVCWTGDNIVGVDPATGTAHWTHPHPSKNMPLGCATPVVEGDRIFFTGFYDGCLMLRLKTDEMAVERLWARRGPSEKRTDGLHSIIATPMFRGDHIYGVDSYGELRCLKASDGSRVWEDQTAVPRARWATIHMVQNGTTTWMFNDRGELLIGELTPAGFQERSRTKVIDPTLEQLSRRDGVCWSHPAFANRHIFARNDKELVCADLSATE